MCRRDLGPEPRQNRAPGECSEHGHQAENAEGHARDAGWNRDQVADHRQQPGEENPDNSVPPHEPLRPFQAIGSDEDEPPPAKNPSPANPPRYPVGNRRTQPRTERPGQYDAAASYWPGRSVRGWVRRLPTGYRGGLAGEGFFAGGGSSSSDPMAWNGRSGS